MIQWWGFRLSLGSSREVGVQFPVEENSMASFLYTFGLHFFSFGLIDFCGSEIRDTARIASFKS